MNQKQLENKAKIAFNNQVESLNSSTLQRLRLARESALSKHIQSSQNNSWFLSPKWIGGAGAGVALAVILTFMIVPSLSHLNTLSPLDDLEMLSAETDIELYTQMEFFQWIDDSALSEIIL